jgi:hypothetical protein
MNKYPIHITSEITLEKLQKGTFIFIFRATRIPPHVGIITGGKLYDITSVGPNIDLPVVDFYNTILKRKTEVVFVELKQKGNIDLNEIITQKVNEYWKVTPTISCLSPIKDFINEAYSVDVSGAKFIFELLPMLSKEDLITGVSQLNLSHKITNSTFELTKYSEKDIENCIEALQRKEKVVC